jgi:asparagine synthase (glutamine-hydrolysing)
MCGICGIAYNDSSRVSDRSRFLAMRDTLLHRGPDDAGHLIEPGIALGSRRLAILDLSERGHMPMTTPDGRYTIIHNGEIYNFQELRATLLARGMTFRSNSDTEVLLSLYAVAGPAMLNQLNGMFAFSIWDSVERVLFIARDRMGIKPVYYAVQPDGFYFASEEKALFAGGVRAGFDASRWEELLCFRYVAGEETPYEGVKRLLPGHYLIWKDGKLHTKRWWCLADRARDLREDTRTDPLAWFAETFDSAIRLRRISDVPIGVLLSGGLDSSSVAASLADQGGKGTASFTVRFDEPSYDEGPLALQIAQRWDLDYHELKVSPDDLLSGLRTASYLNDEPLVHGNDLHLRAISIYAKPRVTVLLSGEGADELLGGYVRYRPLRHPGLLRAMRPVFPAVSSLIGVRGRLKKLARFLSMASLDDFILYNACDVLPADLEAVGMNPAAHFPYREEMLREAKSLYPADVMRQAMYSDQHTFLCSILDRNDRMTMGASIECRVPFLDYRLVEGVSALPSTAFGAGQQSKPLLRKSLGHRLPESILRHRKWGFGVPWGGYLRTIPELRALVAGLPECGPVKHGPFDPARLRNVVAGYLAGNTDHDALIRQLLMIVLWHDVCIEKRITGD